MAENKTTTEIIILAAGDISKKLPYIRSKFASPALIPVNNRPLLWYLLDFYRNKTNFPINVVVSQKQAQNVSNELNQSLHNYSLIALKNSSGVNDSLAQSIKKIKPKKNIIVNLVTTIPTRLPLLNEVQISSKQRNYRVGAGIQFKNNKPIFLTKNKSFLNHAYPFTGLFYTKTAALKKTLTKIENQQDLLELIKRLNQQINLKFKKVNWIDCGHEINYFEARNKLLASRVFNQISVNLPAGVLTKKSKNNKKLANEANFLEKLPEKYRIYFPRLIKTYNNKDRYKIEYYGYPNLAEYMLYWDIDPAHWHKIFSYLEEILKHFQKEKPIIDKKTYQKFYLHKTKKRIKEFLKQIPVKEKELYKKEIQINNLQCQPLDNLSNKIDSRIEKLYAKKHLCIMHGDFCFNNILYDLKTGIIRLIDQRGSLGRSCPGIYGDQKYDIAKLAHSAIYGYDYIVNNLFEIETGKQNIKYRLNYRKENKLIKKLCANLIKKMSYNKNDIKFIVGLLFISMTPLHHDSYHKQKIMYFHGLKLLNEA